MWLTRPCWGPTCCWPRWWRPDFWSPQSWSGGGEIDYPAPLDRLPLLVRGGALLPLGPVRQHIADDHRFDELELHAWPPYPATFTLYDDDGLTRAYQRGAFTATELSVEAAGQNLRLAVGPARGRFAGQPETRRLTAVLHRAEAPAAVRVSGRPWTAWEHDPAARCVRVHAEGAAAEALVVELSA